MNAQEITSKMMRRQVPSDIARHFRDIDPYGLAEIKRSLVKNYFSQPHNCFGIDTNLYLKSAAGVSDLDEHLINRLERHRSIFIPWMSSVRSLKGSNILEIGSGTGCSTVAMAEQGASITGIDIESRSIRVAEDRCQIYGLQPRLLVHNGADIGRLASGMDYDWIIFYAALEHMTVCERIKAIRDAWNALPPKGLFCVIETPNRLWFHDSHTSMLPFFHWLPDDIAIQYARFSKRKGFREHYTEYREGIELDFLRRGRGVSYHEFDLSIGRSECMKVVSSLQLYLRRNIVRKLRWLFSPAHQFERFLIKNGPAIHRGFYQENLCLILQKE
jgi:S-adenosylmethionine-dependent methyltransferase